ncbi:hypothetical protein ERO13_D13G019850v2 [Gossypium hirsutum]|uniref:Uncharacterized protein n=1 Tax=Gossypium barbadense TaxID=3634 RepID=A0A5J5NG52_GOSBA|nr:hypothetical protein ES319_D13G022400v1 [Gossypium barbadense]KAG4109964.1 hypothetical protein ERO13_D13G019850v2 [Gossypium hirsutum]
MNGLIGKMGQHTSNDAEDDLVFDDDELTWGLVVSVAGVGESRHCTRVQMRLRSSASTSQPTFDEDDDIEAERDVNCYDSKEDEDEGNLEHVSYDDI